MDSKITAGGSETPKPVDQSMLNNLLAIFDDKEFMKEMVETHAPDGVEVDVQSLFAHAKIILDGATEVVKNVLNAKDPSQAPSGNVVFPPPKQGFNPPLSAISRVAHQIARKALDTENVRETTEAIFHELSGYSWAGKSVITLSAFAIYYADFWSEAEYQTRQSDKWTDSMAILKGLPELITKSSDSPDNQVFIVLNDMVRITLEMTHCIVDFEHHSNDVPYLSNSIDVARHVYQTIISVLACSIQFTSLISLADEYRARDLRTFTEKVKDIHKNMSDDFKQKKGQISEFKKLENLLSDPPVNVELIKAFFPMHDSQPACFLGSNPTTMGGSIGATNSEHLLPVSTHKQIRQKEAAVCTNTLGRNCIRDDMLKSLQWKNVLLLISDLNLATDDLKILVKIHSERSFQDNRYEILWIPILEQEKEGAETGFGQLRGQMPWYSVHYKAVNQITIRIIKKKWHFKQESVVVVLNRLGKVVNQNAMHIIRIFKSSAFPFTRSKAAILWKRRDISWFKLLVTDIIQDSMDKGKFIFLYGGEDSEAINEIEVRLKNITDSRYPITSFNVSGSHVQLFRSRLESFIISKLRRRADLDDPSMQVIFKLYASFMEGGYVVLAEGSNVVTIGKLAIAAKIWSKFEAWKAQADTDGLGRAFQKQYDGDEANKNRTQCRHFYIPNMVWCMTEDVKCPFCSRTMRTVVKLECCHDAR